MARCTILYSELELNTMNNITACNDAATACYQRTDYNPGSYKGLLLNYLKDRNALNIWQQFQRHIKLV